MSRNAKKIILAVIAVLLLAAAMVFCFYTFSPKPSAGDKTVSVTVAHSDGSEKVFNITTDAEYLWDAMDGQGLIGGTDSDYGKWVTTVDGETADEASGYFWMFTKAGEWVEYACDKTTISDGDAFEFFIYEYTA